MAKSEMTELRFKINLKKAKESQKYSHISSFFSVY